MASDGLTKFQLLRGRLITEQHGFSEDVRGLLCIAHGGTPCPGTTATAVAGT